MSEVQSDAATWTCKTSKTIEELILVISLVKPHWPNIKVKNSCDN